MGQFVVSDPRAMSSLVVLASGLALASAQSNFRCPERDGYFPDPVQCDQYFNVDCGDRLELQPPKGPSDLCPRLNGFYSHPDPGDCAKFYICLNGISPREQGCELGLVYNEVSKQCDAPENVPECKDYYAFLEDGDQSKKRRK